MGEYGGGEAGWIFPGKRSSSAMERKARKEHAMKSSDISGGEKGEKTGPDNLHGRGERRQETRRSRIEECSLMPG